jgi:hypothetical protein
MSFEVCNKCRLVRCNGTQSTSTTESDNESQLHKGRKL